MLSFSAWKSSNAISWMEKGNQRGLRACVRNYGYAPPPNTISLPSYTKRFDYEHEYDFEYDDEHEHEKHVSEFTRMRT
jgi:hypothetical protein